MAFIYLKIKAAALTAESRLIRAEENRRRYPRLLSQQGVAKERDTPKLAHWPHGIEPPAAVETSEDPQERMRRVQEWRLYRKRCKARVHSPATRTLLHFRRTGKLRDEARAVHLAKAFLRGKPYSHVENKLTDWSRIGRSRQAGIFASMCAMVLRYGYTRLPPLACDTRARMFTYLVEWSYGGPSVELPAPQTRAVAA